MTDVPLHEQIASAKRELAMRRRVYPKWVAGGRMKADAANHEIAAMEAIVETLSGLRQEDLLFD